MKLVNNEIILSATDLSNHLSCKHLTQLNQKHAKQELQRPVRHNQFLKRIQDMGEKHEAAYLDHLRRSGHTVLEIDFKDPAAQRKTLAAMQDGVAFIAQGQLSNDNWSGRPDLLVRVGRPCPAFGSWSYEVADTKLTRTTKSGTILQLCVYSDLLAENQQTPPEFMHVIMPANELSGETGFTEEAHRCDNYAAFYRLAKQRLLDDIASNANTYAEPVSHCEICQWWPDCDKRRRDDDHLTFVAGIQKSQIEALVSHNITTLTDLANTEEAMLSQRIDGSVEAIDRIHQQARIQHKGRTTGTLEFEYLPVAYPQEGDHQRRGFLRLPAPDPNGDLFFDIESARHVPGGGLEYLLGFATVSAGAKEPGFEYVWGMDRQGEKAAFEQFIDLVVDRLSEYPNMHVYHFAPYEPVALKRLATRHATREAELDTLLRKQCFVDLYAVTRQAIRASVESYSIKCLEPFYGFHREEALADARLSMHRLESMLERGIGNRILSEDKAVVLKYNRDDCLSTLALRDWLESLREQQIATGVDLPRPPAPAEYSPEQDERAPQVQQVFDELTTDFRDTSPAEWTDEQQARWLLAHALDYFRREEKNAWWEYFRLRELDTTDLLKERNAIQGLSLLSEVPPQGRSTIPSHVYEYPEQFVTIDEGDELYEASSEDGKPGEFKIGTVVNIDYDTRTIEVKKTKKTVGKHPLAVFHHRQVRPDPMPETLLEFGKLVASSPIVRIKSAQYDLLTRQEPRLRGTNTITALMNPAIGSVEQAWQLVSKLDHSVLAIQGPPGTGKTYTGSHVIAKLLRDGKRVGITAVSHAVIGNLLSAVQEADSNVAIAHKGNKQQVTNIQCERLSDKDDVLAALQSRKAVGATAFTWAALELNQQLDYLFIDEAGQMSLAMALTAARAAKNVVLLGDPQQLEQPQRAAHPEGSHIAALAHLIGDRQTIREEQGLFLDTTYRMHPNICTFTSDQYYEGRLHAQLNLARQTITGSAFNDAQLVYHPFEHTGNQARSEEEAQAIASMIQTMLERPHHWTDSENRQSQIQPPDILVIAPYNAQVALLKRVLPDGVRIGTVDKFQGQQAPVVFYSMTSSSVEDAPRGMGFLFSPNRFNVATSRAKCTVIVVGSPALIYAQCSTPVQIQWANGLCRFVELANARKTRVSQITN